MIKKSIETVKRNPVILKFVLLLFAFDVIRSIVDMELMYKMMYGNLGLVDYKTGFYATYGILWFINIVYAVFLFGPMIYLIYEGAVGKVQKGWYKTGIKRSFVRYLPLYLLFIVYGTYRSWFFEGALFHNMATVDNIFTMAYLEELVRIVFFFPFYFIAIPVMAEDRLIIGYKNIFTVGRKYFFKFIILYFFTYQSSAFFSILVDYPFFEKIRVYCYFLSVIRNIFSAIMITVLYIIGMNMYVSKRTDINLLKEEGSL